MINIKSKNSLPKVYVYKMRKGESKPERVATFFTSYRARQFVLQLLAREPKARDYQWVIRTSPMPY